MSKHEKFQYEDLPKSAVVNSNNYVEETEINEFVTKVVAEHLNQITQDSQASPKSVESNTGENIDVQEAVDATKKLAKNIDEFQEPDKVAADQTQVAPEPKAETIDQQQLYQQAYDKGYQEAQAKLQEQQQPQIDEQQFQQLLQEKLALVQQEETIDQQITKVFASSIAEIVKKLYLILPVDFEKIIKEGLVSKIEKFYTQGELQLTVSPERVELCEKLLKSEAISEKLRASITIKKDENLAKDDCVLTWDATRLEYNQEQLTEEIDKIIAQIKSAI